MVVKHPDLATSKLRCCCSCFICFISVRRVNFCSGFVSMLNVLLTFLSERNVNKVYDVNIQQESCDLRLLIDRTLAAEIYISRRFWQSSSDLVGTLNVDVHGRNSSSCLSLITWQVTLSSLPSQNRNLSIVTGFDSKNTHIWALKTDPHKYNGTDYWQRVTALLSLLFLQLLAVKLYEFLHW